MDVNIFQTLILLTYKGKALLMYKRSNPVDVEKHTWCFIGGIKGEQESFENAIARWVQKETGVLIENVEYVSNYCYHARLTDDHVNKIERVENQLLNFFSLTELKKLSLSNPTAQFVLKHGTLI